MKSFFPARGDKIQVEGQRSQILDNARDRIVLLGAAFLIIFMLIGARLFDVMIIQGTPVKISDSSNWQQQGNAADPLLTRADIIDRNGVLLATTIKSTSLYADPKLIVDPKNAAAELVKIFPDLKREKLEADLTFSGKRFVWLVRHITPEQQEAVLYIGDPGLAFQEEGKRIYPQGALTAHLVGTTSIDGLGQSGLERSLEEKLKSGGQVVQTALDVRIQHAVRRELINAIEDFDAKAGVGMVMDIHTGEIIAGVSYPDFDPNFYNESDKDAQFNRMTLGVYELGSIFKVFSTAAYLEIKDNGFEHTFDASEPMKRGRFTIRDYHAENRIMTVPEVFMHSSNIGAAMMGERVGSTALKAYYKKLGLLEAAPIEIKELGKPMVPNPWRDITTVTASYGHGIAVSPLHMVRAVAALVGDGMLRTPTLLKDDKRINKIQERVASEETVERIRQLMRLTVTQGTGAKAEVAGYRVGGKTGTAEQPGTRGYNRNHLISSFVGMFPADDPQYVILVTVDSPKGQKKSHGYATAGWVAAPAVSRIISSFAPLFGIDPMSENEMAESGFVDISDQLSYYVREDAKEGR